MYSSGGRPGEYSGSGAPAGTGGPGGAGEGERGLGATLIGAAGGGFLGHEVGGGALATIGGMIAGAVGANKLEGRRERWVFFLVFCFLLVRCPLPFLSGES